MAYPEFAFVCFRQFWSRQSEASGVLAERGVLGVAKAIERRWWCVWPLLGIASSFHILIGGWAVVACTLAWLMRWKEEKLSVVELAIWLVIGGCFALPGLIPAIQLTAQSTPEEISQANLTYTFRRLSHHLIFYRFAKWDPRLPNFNVVRPVSFAVLLLAWWQVSKWHPTNERVARLRAIVNGSLCIAAMGIVLDTVLGPFPETRAGLMRFYWFRLSDIMVPVGIAIAVAATLDMRNRRPLQALLFVAVIAAAVGIGNTMPKHGFGARSTSLQQQNWRGTHGDTDVNEVDDAWRDVCEWIRSNDRIAPTSVFLTPTRQQTFKWYAQRPDVVTWKDVPQDAGGLNEWWQRRQEVYLLGDWPWRDPAACANIVEKYGVTHIVWPAPPSGPGSNTTRKQPVPDSVRQVYRNDLFRVFDLTP